MNGLVLLLRGPRLVAEEWVLVSSCASIDKYEALCVRLGEFGTAPHKHHELVATEHDRFVAGFGRAAHGIVVHCCSIMIWA